MCRSAFRRDWWVSCCFWKRRVCRWCLSEGVEAVLGAADWCFTIPTTASPRQLPTGWWSKLGPRSCTACETGVSASWCGARSRNHDGMCTKEWHTAWAAPEPATKSQFWTFKCKDALVCGSLQWKSQMCTSTTWSRGRKGQRSGGYWRNASFHSSS